MKKIDKIFDDLHYELITEKQAKQQVLELFSVSNSFVYVLVINGSTHFVFTKYQKAYRLMKKLKFENIEIQRWRIY